MRFCGASAGKSINVEWFLLRFLDLVRDIRILKGLDRSYPLPNVYSWYSKKKKSTRDTSRPGLLRQELDLRICFLKISDLFYIGLFFDEDNIGKLGIDHATYEEIAVTDG